jgi:hypothetical protein
MKLLLISVLFTPLFMQAMISNITPMSNQTFQNMIINGGESQLEDFIQRVDEAPEEQQQNMLNDIDFEAAKAYLKKALPYESNMLSPGLQTIANGTIGFACIGAAVVTHDPLWIVLSPILMINAGWSCVNIGTSQRASSMLSRIEQLEKKRPAPIEIELIMEQ